MRDLRIGMATLEVPLAAASASSVPVSADLDFSNVKNNRLTLACGFQPTTEISSALTSCRAWWGRIRTSR